MSKENQRLTGVDQNTTFIDRLSIKASTLKDTFLNLKGFKGVDSKDIHIKGIDPKSYGSFDRTMNYVTGFFNKRRVAFAALLTLTSCTTGGVIGVSVLTSEPRETSTQPGDLTKTSESPTEATYAITSTPGIESTINPPTEEATEMPTLTKTEMPTPTEIPEKYPIDLEKLVTPPESFEELKQHPEKFVQSPNPMKNFEEFIKWYNETLFEKALGGDLDKLPINYKVTDIGIAPGDRIMAENKTEGEVLSVPKFFYFKDQNQFYPSYIVTLEYNGYILSYTVVMKQSLIEKYGDYQMFVDISEGKRDLKILQFSLSTNESYPEGEKKLYEQGFGSYPSTISEIPIGIGTIFYFGD